MFLLSPGISEFRIILFRIEKSFLVHNQCKPPSKVQVHQLLPNCLACIQAMKPQSALIQSKHGAYMLQCVI